MHIVTVDNFLCCLSLEFGGYFLGWLGVISSISALVMAVGVGVLAYMSFETLSDYVTLSAGGVNNEWITTIVLYNDYIFFAVLAFVTLFLLFCLYAQISLLVGIKNRNHERIVPILAIIVLELLLNLLQLLSWNWQSITSVVLSTIIDLYIYICIYSLYVKLKNEKKYKFPA